MFLSISAALFSAFALYAFSYRTRGLAENNQAIERQISDLRREIAILRAERAYLMRPDRIEPLARQLGMEPVRGGQFASQADLAGNGQ
ncbi:MAG: cell division protein FtsL [Alphaproteobacteria bacterium]|nr:cell division protein FtsL [Alphaproteobacteria bacterium]